MKNHDNQNDVPSNLKQSTQQNKNDDSQDKAEKKPKKHRIRKFFRVLFVILMSILSIVVILCSSIVVLEAMSDPNSMPGSFDYKPCVERYGLMEPVMQKGDLIFVKKTDPSELEVGDIVAFHIDGNDSIGRIVSLSSSGLNVKADQDGLVYGVFVPNDCIQGKWYGFRIPVLGWIVLFIQNSWWVLIIIPCLIEIFILLGYLLRKSIPHKTKTNDDGSS